MILYNSNLQDIFLRYTGTTDISFISHDFSSDLIASYTNSNYSVCNGSVLLRWIRNIISVEWMRLHQLAFAQYTALSILLYWPAAFLSPSATFELHMTHASLTVLFYFKPKFLQFTLYQSIQFSYVFFIFICIFKWIFKNTCKNHIF